MPEEAAEAAAEEAPEEPAEAENGEEELLDEELEALLEEEIAVEEEAPDVADEITDTAETLAEEVGSFVTTSEEWLNQTVKDAQETQKVRLAAFSDEIEAKTENGEKIASGEMCALLQAAALSGDVRKVADQFFGQFREGRWHKEKSADENGADENGVCENGVDENAAGEQGIRASVVEEGEMAKTIWTLYESYGDKAILDDNYDLIKDMIASVSKQDPDESFIVSAPKLADDDTDPSFVATVSYYEMVRTAAKAAKVLQKEEDEKQFDELAGKIREAFLDEFFSRSGRLAEDTQTAYILALESGLCDKKEKLAEDFCRQLGRDNYVLKCGKAGRSKLPFVLADCGESDLAYRYLMNDWMTETGNDETNARTAEFLTRYVCGITPKEPGFAKVKIAPMPSFRLIDAAAACASPQGNIVSDWDVNDAGEIHFHFEIPDGVEAEIILPDCGDETIREQTLTAGSYDFAYLPEKDYLHLFHEDSMIGDILKYNESVAILEEADASLAEQVQEAGADFLTKPLSDLPVDEETLQTIKEQLFQLK